MDPTTLALLLYAMGQISLWDVVLAAVQAGVPGPVGPQGPAGKTGATGPTGPVGPSGASTLMVVADITARDAIPGGSRFDGLLVETIDVPRTLWILGAGLGNADWQSFNTSGLTVSAEVVGGNDVARIQTGARVLELDSSGADLITTSAERLGQNSSRHVKQVLMNLGGVAGLQVAVNISDPGEHLHITMGIDGISVGGFLVPNSLSTLLTTGRVMVCCNTSTFTFTLVDEEPTATAARRLRLPGRVNADIPPAGTFVLAYDTLDARWRVVLGQAPPSAPRFVVTFGPQESTMSAADDGGVVAEGYYLSTAGVTFAQVALPPLPTGYSEWAIIDARYSLNSGPTFPTTDVASLIINDFSTGGAAPGSPQVTLTPTGADGTTEGACSINVTGANSFVRWFMVTLAAATLNAGNVAGLGFSVTFEAA